MSPFATSSVVHLRPVPAVQDGSDFSPFWNGVPQDRVQAISALPRFHEVDVALVSNIIGQIATIERQHGEDVALAVVEDLKRLWAKRHLTLVQ